MRHEVPEEHVWNLTDLFASETDFDAALQALSAELETLSRFGTQALERPPDVLAYLQARDGILAQGQRVVGYAMAKFSEDGTDPENQTRLARARQAGQALERKLTQLRDVLFAVSAERLQHWAQSQGPLSAHRMYLLQVAQGREHVLPPGAEEALAAVAPALQLPGTLYRTVTGADLRCASVPDEQGQTFSVTHFSFMTRAETSDNWDFRARCYQSLVAGQKPYHHTLATTLATEIQKNAALAKLRGYPSSAAMLLREASESAGPPDNVAESFFERVPMLILKALAPYMQRYARLRSRRWRVSRLRYCDVKAPVLEIGAKHVSYDALARTICEAVASMGTQYQRIVERAFAERWVYRADNVGNLQGAYCMPIPGRHPYVFSPYHGVLYDIFMTAHELGHAVHMTLADSREVAHDLLPSQLFIEAPSTFNEHLVAQHMRRTSDEQGRLEVNCLQLLTFHHNFVTHLIEAELLRRLYKMADAGEVLTAAVLDRVQLEILREFWDETVELDEGAAMTWMRQAHYYSGLYPYTYAVGLTASTLLAQRLSEGQQVASSWIRVLQMGGSRDALELFREVGIEMDAEQPYQEAASYVGRLIDELESALV